MPSQHGYRCHRNKEKRYVGFDPLRSPKQRYVCHQIIYIISRLLFLAFYWYSWLFMDMSPFTKYIVIYGHLLKLRCRFIYSCMYLWSFWVWFMCYISFSYHFFFLWISNRHTILGTKIRQEKFNQIISKHTLISTTTIMKYNTNNRLHSTRKQIIAHINVDGGCRDGALRRGIVSGASNLFTGTWVYEDQSVHQKAD